MHRNSTKNLNDIFLLLFLREKMKSVFVLALVALCMADSEHEITEYGNLLTAEGEVREPGWARKQMLTYNREDINALGVQIKEWDYYAISGCGRNFVLTISDVGYFGMVSSSIITNWYEGSGENTSLFNDIAVRLLSSGNMNLPRDIMNGTIDVTEGKASAKVTATPDGNRHIQVTWDEYGSMDKDNFIAKFGALGMSADLVLYHDPNSDHIMVATPFENSKSQFYFNQKINTMRVKGTLIVGQIKMVYDDDNVGLAVLDWGRGVWPYSDSWIWASASGEATLVKTDGTEEIVEFGLNMGEGFGNLSSHSENCMFVNGKIVKFGKLSFAYNSLDWYEPWHITNEDNTLNLQLQVYYVLPTVVDVGVLGMNSHQSQGVWRGSYTYPDGTVLKLDGVIGFSEYVHNKW